MSAITAIILSAKPVALEIPGVTVLPSVQVLASVEALHSARLDALARVATPYCFFLDDDDALPEDYQGVLKACMGQMAARGVPMAYTDEIMREQGKADVRRSWYEYDNTLHARSPMGLHHLVVMDTAAAQTVARALPRGNFWTEHMLYWALGRAGATYVPRTGYIWQRKAGGGFSGNPRILTAIVFGQRWIAQQGGL